MNASPPHRQVRDGAKPGGALCSATAQQALTKAAPRTPELVYLQSFVRTPPRHHRGDNRCR